MLKADPAAEYRRQAKAAATGTSEFAKLTEREKVHVGKMMEQILSIRQRRLIEANAFHSVADCDRHRIQQIMEVRNRLMELPRSLALGLVGLPAEEIERTIDQVVRVILEEFGAKATPVELGGDDGQ
jgi:hypothetical protein